MSTKLWVSVVRVLAFAGYTAILFVLRSIPGRAQILWGMAAGVLVMVYFWTWDHPHGLQRTKNANRADPSEPRK